MRYMLILHGTEAALLERAPEWREEAVEFMARFNDELAVSSELEYTELVDDEAHAVCVGPGGDVTEGWYNKGARPLQRIWVVRVAGEERARELAGRIAGELDTWVEVRRCLAGAHRP